MGVSACIQEPDYSNVPEIAFVRLEKKHVDEFREPPLGGPAVRVVFDSVAVTISFKDGDGDIGLEQADSLPPYNEFEYDSNGKLLLDSRGQRIPSDNRFSRNWFVDVERKEGTEWVKLTFLQGADFNRRLPRLNTLGNRRALEGEITNTLQLILRVTSSPIREGDVLRLRISMADRALNLSNEVISDEFVVGN